MERKAKRNKKHNEIIVQYLRRQGYEVNEPIVCKNKVVNITLITLSILLFILNVINVVLNPISSYSYILIIFLDFKTLVNQAGKAWIPNKDGTEIQVSKPSIRFCALYTVLTFLSIFPFMAINIKSMFTPLKPPWLFQIIIPLHYCVGLIIDITDSFSQLYGATSVGKYKKEKTIKGENL